MNNDNTFWLTLWLFILMAVVAIALGVAGIVTAHYDHMAELGYEETVVPGRCSPVWKKVAPAKIEVKCDCPRNDAIYTITNWCQLVDAYCTTSNTFRDVQYYLKDAVATNAGDAVNWDMVESPIPGGVLFTGWTDGRAKREAEPRAGGLVICFGCRRSYSRDPIAATWHTEFCPKCAPEDDPRWTDTAKQLWTALNRELGRDVKKDIEWEAL